MAASFDIVIRNGTVIDGTGARRLAADVAIVSGRIVEVGMIAGRGKQEIDAAGCIVTPGFIDVHTHFDGQAIWSDRFTPSSWHGVTTVVTGNCGVGFAPCRPGDRKRLVSLMEGIEDIPEIVLTAGLAWDWESFPEYLDAVERRPHDIDVVAMVPHSALRVFAMGERGAAREAATDEDVETMAHLMGEALEAGALGFATSRLIFHRAANGDIIPTHGAAERELHALANVMHQAGRGVLQIVEDFPSGCNVETDFGMLRRLSERSGRPLCFTIQQFNDRPDQWRDLLAQIEKANAEGVEIRGQFLPRSLGVLFGHLSSANPFASSPAFQALGCLPLAERLSELRKAEVKRRILAEPPNLDNPLVRLAQDYARMFQVKDPPDYEPPQSESAAALARAEGVTPREFVYDALLEDEGRALWSVAFSNYSNGNLEPAAQLLRHPNAIPSLGDAGAHCGLITDASFTTHLLSYWTRDRPAGRIELEEAVRKLTGEPAWAMRISDRGTISPGYKADLNVIDYEALRLRAPYVSYDLPGQGRRMNQRAEGYEATIVSGEIVYRRGEPTGALPGRLVRMT
jgi:N-acyl-D-amino-acid deacylase